jgi:hypothetical protein
VIGVNGTHDKPLPYEAPALRLLGSVPELTQQLQDKKFGPTDGFTFQGISITNASP